MDLLKNFELMKQGAEAKLYKGVYLGKSSIVKERFPKLYRHSVLDENLTKERIRAEARSIIRCKTVGVRTPALYLVDVDRRRIYMEYVENSITVKDYIENLSEVETGDHILMDHLARAIGKVLGRMHSNNIIHGDLTTSNMLVVQAETDTPTIILIDFGLSHMELCVEDKGVDLYVLERALISTHSSAERIFPPLLESYVKENRRQSAEVLKKFEDVRARGRKRTMVG